MKTGLEAFQIKIGSTSELRYMIGKEIVKMIIAITKMIEAKAANIAVDTEYEKIRVKDFSKHVESKGVNMNEDFSSWPDDFEEDWE
jgi:hypothetical protein